MSLCFSLVESIQQRLVILSDGRCEFEVLQGIQNIPDIVQPITYEAHIFRLPVTKHQNFVIEQYESHLLVRVCLPDLVDLGLNGAEHALHPRDVGLVLIVRSGQVVELGLIARLHELLQHLDFLLGQSELQIHLSRDFRGGVHATRNIDAEDDGRIVFALSLLQCAFEHVDHIVLHGYFLLLNEKLVGVVAELTQPEGLIGLQLVGVHHQVLLVLDDGVFVQDCAAFFAFVGVAANEVLLCLFGAIECQDENIEIYLRRRRSVEAAEEGSRQRNVGCLPFGLFCDIGVVGCFFHLDKIVWDRPSNGWI